jgi:hypothetical protein
MSTPTDPAGSEFDMYAEKPPSSDWSYILDDYGIQYRRGLVAQRLRPGWWPFAYADSNREQEDRHRHYPPVPMECGSAFIRLAPDTKYWAWRNEYVSVAPDGKVPHLASASLDIYVRPQGMGGITVPCGVQLDMKAQTYTLTRVGDDWPPELVAQAEGKAAKLLAYLVNAIAERDSGRERPETAHERYDAKRVKAAWEL